MKNLIKLALFSSFLILTSCAHHHGCKGDSKSSSMEKCKECAKGEQCQMKSETSSETKK